jgi:hypothetical protein
MTMLRWLHFTDLHIGQKELKQGYWSSIRDAIHADLRTTVARRGPIDLVLFTGDLAFSGAKEQYEELDREYARIEEILAAAHPDAPRPVLLAVPGNHDLALPEADDPVAEQLLGEKPNGREAVWSGKGKQIEAIRSWFAEYAAWWDRRRPASAKVGLLPGDFVHTFEKEGLRVGFLGLNVASLHVSNDVKEGQFWADPRQILEACGGSALDWADAHHFAFLLTHHPPTWLAPDAKARLDEMIAPAGRFAAHLCGHLHDARVEAATLGRGATRETWQGAALFGRETLKDGKTDRRHGYTIGELHVDEDGAATTTLRPRLAVKRQDGRWRLTADNTHELVDDLLATPVAAAAMRGVLPPRKKDEDAKARRCPATWREAVETSPIWGTADPMLPQVHALATRIAGICWERWKDADEKVPGDPWRDEHLPIRTLQRLEALVQAGELNAVEAAYLLLAPIVREAIFSAGAQWMDEELARGEAGSLARKILDEMERARPDLVRRREKVTGTPRAAVEHWLRTRALRQCPQLWDDALKLGPAAELRRGIERAAREAGVAWMQLDELMVLVRHVGVNAEVFQAEETIDRKPEIKLGSANVRRSGIARLLCAAGAWALELRRAEDLVADHAGREGFEVTIAREAIRGARWDVGKDGARLVVSCADPVVDFMLRDDLVARADVARAAPSSRHGPLRRRSGHRHARAASAPCSPRAPRRRARRIGCTPPAVHRCTQTHPLPAGTASNPR